ncbi:hypothetical protein OED52_13750 [Rhodococcus sp. Z13]|uniref:Uncharacterized protein n=1 Tax=Rhodococcus sacchari TaxID=2962047 RepID=A0ACD4DCH0_9NOCA|nr:hypothetical protein [Rhodococcus sp. Z13]UYP17736.1 hypothetical protein OED52_13750 [Rhodococcus sp. Z13]
MTPVSTRCPTCGSDFLGPDDVTDPPDDGDVAVCLTCSDLIIWSKHHGWETPDPELRAELLRTPQVIESLMALREYHEQQEADRQQLHSLITHGYLSGASIPDIVEAILDDGFHRHPTHNGEDKAK